MTQTSGRQWSMIMRCDVRSAATVITTCMLAAWVLAGCDRLDRTTADNSVDVTDAYAAILEDMADWGPSYIGGREFRLSILPTRAYSDLPAVGQEVLTALAGRGYRAADTTAPLCDGK